VSDRSCQFWIALPSEGRRTMAMQKTTFFVLLTAGLNFLATAARADVRNIWVGVSGATCPT